MFTEGTITFDNDIKYPSVSTTSLKGAGTKENPWLISSKDDLIYLSDMVNSQPASKNICDGEYFKLTADIDMSKYRFTAISKDYDHIFNGIFDGDGHTIEGLTIVAPANTYAGLFGRTGEQKPYHKPDNKKRKHLGSGFCRMCRGLVYWRSIER